MLTIAFIVLKLTGHINWSWWWVLSPAWILVAVLVLVLAIGVVVAFRNDGKRRNFRYW